MQITVTDRPALRMMPTAVTAAATVAVVFGDAVASTSGIDHGPEYGFYGVIIASIIGAVGLVYANRRRRFPETPDVAGKLEGILASIAEVRTMVQDDRVNVAARLAESQRVTDEKITSTRHEIKNDIAKLVLMVDNLDKHLRPWPNREDPK